MLTLQIIKKICNEHDNFCSNCPFRSQHLTGKFSDCMFYSFPYDWNIDEISKAFDDTHIIDKFYTELTHKLLKIMPSKYIDKDKLAAVYEEDADEN